MFWDNFVYLCKINNTNPSAVCKKLGFSNAASTHWKQGTIPKMPTLEKIAGFFNVTVSNLIDETNSIVESNWISPEPPLKVALDLGNATSGIIGTVQKESLPIKTTRSEMFNILSQLTDDELDDLLNYARFLLSKR